MEGEGNKIGGPAVAEQVNQVLIEGLAGITGCRRRAAPGFGSPLINTGPRSRLKANISSVNILVAVAALHYWPKGLAAAIMHQFHLVQIRAAKVSALPDHSHQAIVIELDRFFGEMVDRVAVRGFFAQTVDALQPVEAVTQHALRGTGARQHLSKSINPPEHLLQNQQTPFIPYLVQCSINRAGSGTKAITVCFQLSLLPKILTTAPPGMEAQGYPLRHLDSGYGPLTDILSVKNL